DHRRCRRGEHRRRGWAGPLPGDHRRGPDRLAPRGDHRRRQRTRRPRRQGRDLGHRRRAVGHASGPDEVTRRARRHHDQGLRCRYGEGSADPAGCAVPGPVTAAVAATAAEGVVRRPRGVLVTVAVSAVLLVTMIIAVAVGPLSLTPAEVLGAIAHGLGLTDSAGVSGPQQAVVWDIRLPRVLLAAMVGGCLAIAGAALQGLFGNSLADAGVIGVTSGASLGAICAIVLGLTFLGAWTVPVMAFLFGVATTGMIYVLARPGRSGGTVQLLLVGIAITAMTGSVNGFFTYIADTTELESITYWSM